MRILDDPTLRDCARLVQRHTDATPELRTRLLTGLDAVDRELAELRDLIMASAAAATETAVKGKR